MKNIKDYCVPYNIAIILKQKQFDDLSFCNYNPNGVLFWKFKSASEDEDYTLDIYDIVKQQPEDYIEAPTYEQVINWLDEKHKIRICLSTAKTSGKYRYDIIQFIEDKWQGDYNLSSFYTSTERNIKSINEALELI